MFTYFVFLPLVVVVVLWAFTFNYRRFRNEPWYAELEPGESETDRIEIQGLLRTTRMVLTDRRVIEQRIDWPLVRRAQRAVGWEDVRAVTWRASVGILLLVFAILLFGRLNPLALLVLLYALQTPVATVSFHTSYLHLPTVRPSITAANRAEHAGLARFYATASRSWLQFHGRKLGAISAPRPFSSVEPLGAYSWSRALWVHLLLLGGMGLVSRVAYGHLVMTDLLLTPLFLGLTIAVAGRGPMRDTIWAGVLSPLMLLAVKFPAGLLAGMLLNDGGADLGECGLIFLGFLLVAAVSRGLHSFTAVPLFPLAALCWPALLLLADRVGTLDWALAAQTLLAIAAAVIGRWLYEAWGEESSVSPFPGLPLATAHSA